LWEEWEVRFWAARLPWEDWEVFPPQQQQAFPPQQPGYPPQQQYPGQPPAGYPPSSQYQHPSGPSHSPYPAHEERGHGSYPPQHGAPPHGAPGYPPQHGYPGAPHDPNAQDRGLGATLVGGVGGAVLGRKTPLGGLGGAVAGAVAANVGEHILRRRRRRASTARRMVRGGLNITKTEAMVDPQAQAQARIRTKAICSCCSFGAEAALDVGAEGLLRRKRSSTVLTCREFRAAGTDSLLYHLSFRYLCIFTA